MGPEDQLVHLATIHCQYLAYGLRRHVLVYRRDWLIGACTYRLQQQENVRLLYVCAY